MFCWILFLSRISKSWFYKTGSKNGYWNDHRFDLSLNFIVEVEVNTGTAPSEFSLLTPEDSSSVTVTDGSTDEYTFSWEEPYDEEHDALEYYLNFEGSAVVGSDTLSWTTRA